MFDRNCSAPKSITPIDRPRSDENIIRRNRFEFGRETTLGLLLLDAICKHRIGFDRFVDNAFEFPPTQHRNLIRALAGRFLRQLVDLVEKCIPRVDAAEFGIIVVNDLADDRLHRLIRIIDVGEHHFEALLVVLVSVFEFFQQPCGSVILDVVF